MIAYMRAPACGNYLRMRGEEHGKVSVKLYQHALGQAAAPAQTMVPAARSRAEWMDKLRPFELVRRQTQH